MNLTGNNLNKKNIINKENEKNPCPKLSELKCIYAHPLLPFLLMTLLKVGGHQYPPQIPCGDSLNSRRVCIDTNSKEWQGHWIWYSKHVFLWINVAEEPLCELKSNPTHSTDTIWTPYYSTILKFYMSQGPQFIMCFMDHFLFLFTNIQIKHLQESTW